MRGFWDSSRRFRWGRDDLESGGRTRARVARFSGGYEDCSRGKHSVDVLTKIGGEGDLRADCFHGISATAASAEIEGGPRVHHQSGELRVGWCLAFEHHENSFGRIGAGGNPHRGLANLNPVSPDVSGAVGVAHENAERSRGALARSPDDPSLGVGHRLILTAGSTARQENIGRSPRLRGDGTLPDDGNRGTIVPDPVDLFRKRVRKSDAAPEAGYPGSLPACMAMPVEVRRCM